MSTTILKAEAEQCLAQIYQDFNGAITGPVHFPLTDLTACRTFSAVMTLTLAKMRRTGSPLPPTAMILAMTRVCNEIIDPPAESFKWRDRNSVMPRAFAHEVLERLRAELPPSFDFAVDQVGRIMNEAGDLDNAHRVRRAFRSYRARHKGALLVSDLDQMVRQVWNNRYPHHAELLQETFLREAA